MNWISVEERLPDITDGNNFDIRWSDNILIPSPYGTILMGRYIECIDDEIDEVVERGFSSEEGGYFKPEYGLGEITHWMPLPPPPKQNK